MENILGKVLKLVASAALITTGLLLGPNGATPSRSVIVKKIKR